MITFDEHILHLQAMFPDLDFKLGSNLRAIALLVYEMMKFEEENK